MHKRFVAAALSFGLALSGASSTVFADSIGRYDCIIVGTIIQEPVGDRERHDIVSLEYTCRGLDGLLKDAGVTAVSVGEWDGQKGKYLASLGIHRAPGGIAVGQLLEGTSSLVMKDGKPLGIEASGTTVFKFASGTLAAISGKTVKFATKPTDLGRFVIEFSE
jgi:hypothetical protein